MKKAKYRYIGAGNYLIGIPARDLTEDDLKGLDIEDLERSGLYLAPQGDEVIETHMKTGASENFSLKQQEKNDHGRN